MFVFLIETCNICYHHCVIFRTSIEASWDDGWFGFSLIDVWSLKPDLRCLVEDVKRFISSETEKAARSLLHCDRVDH